MSSTGPWPTSVINTEVPFTASINYGKNDTCTIMVHHVDHDNGHTHIIGNYLSLPNWLGLFPLLGLIVNVGERAEINYKRK